MPRRSAPLRGIALDELKSIRFCQLHESHFVTLAAQLAVLCQQWGIDADNGVIYRLVDAGLSLFLTPSGGALAQRFRCVANAQIECLCSFNLETSRSAYRTGYDTDHCATDWLLAGDASTAGCCASAVPPIAVQPRAKKLATTMNFANPD
jgi:hypothetical protein